MKPIQLHPFSLLAGLVGGFGALMLMSQAVTTTFPSARVEVGPHPRDMIQIIGAQTYVVPPGKILTLTALGAVQAPSQPVLPPNFTVDLQINGQTATRMYWGGTFTTVDSTVKALPTGLTAHWGDVVTMQNGMGYPGPEFRAWGYLADR